MWLVVLYLSKKKLNIQKFVIMQLLGSFTKWTCLMQYLCNSKSYENLNQTAQLNIIIFFILISSTFTLGSHNANFAMIIMTFACHHIDISTVACDSHCNVMPFLVVIMPIYVKFYHQNASHELVIRH
jgi:hypothetical protein